MRPLPGGGQVAVRWTSELSLNGIDQALPEAAGPVRSGRSRDTTMHRRW